MRRAMLFALLAIGVSMAAPAGAEQNPDPARGIVPVACPDQPEPQWMQGIDPRDAHKRLLVQQIYRAASMQRILDAGSCTCDTRYPPWDAAEAVFFEGFVAADYQDIVEATEEYRWQANRLRLNAMPICEAAGSW